MAFWPDAKGLAVGCQGITEPLCFQVFAEAFWQVSMWLLRCSGWLILEPVVKAFYVVSGWLLWLSRLRLQARVNGASKPLLVRLKLNLFSFLDDFWCCIHFPFDQKVWQKPCYNLTFSRMWDSPTVWCPARVGTDPRWTGDLTNANLWLIFTENSSFKGNYSLINTFL